MNTALSMQATGEQGLSMYSSHCPDLVLLDLGLPDMDGMEVLHKIRQWSHTPIIVVSARQSEREIVQALDLGANDYMTKPIGNSELLARIRSCLRQHSRIKENLAEIDIEFRLGGLNLNYSKRIVTFEGKIIKVTPTEYKLLTLLAKNAGKVLTHDFMIKEVWGPYMIDHQILRVNMANIRRKLEPKPADPIYILTEVGIGYRLVDSIEENI